MVSKPRRGQAQAREIKAITKIFVGQILLDKSPWPVHLTSILRKRFNDKSYYHAWKMTLVLTLEEHEVFDYV